MKLEADAFGRNPGNARAHIEDMPRTILNDSKGNLGIGAPIDTCTLDLTQGHAVLECQEHTTAGDLPNLKSPGTQGHHGDKGLRHQIHARVETFVSRILPIRVHASAVGV